MYSRVRINGADLYRASIPRLSGSGCRGRNIRICCVWSSMMLFPSLLLPFWCLHSHCIPIRCSPSIFNLLEESEPHPVSLVVVVRGEPVQHGEDVLGGAVVRLAWNEIHEEAQVTHENECKRWTWSNSSTRQLGFLGMFEAGRNLTNDCRNGRRGLKNKFGWRTESGLETGRIVTII